MNAAIPPPVPDMIRRKRLTDLLVSSAQRDGYSPVELAVTVAGLYECALLGHMGPDAQDAAEMMTRCMKASAS